MSVTTVMDTPFGEVEVIVNSEDRIAIFANGPLNVPDRRRTVVVNRVEYVVAAHFVRLAADIPMGDGSVLSASTWVTGAERSYPGVSGTHFTCHKAAGGHSDYSWSAWDKLKAGLTEALNAWVHTAAGRSALVRAGVAEHVKAVNEADATVKRLSSELEAAKSRLRDLQALTPAFEAAGAAVSV